MESRALSPSACLRQGLKAARFLPVRGPVAHSSDGARAQIDHKPDGAQRARLTTKKDVVQRIAHHSSVSKGNRGRLHPGRDKGWEGGPGRRDFGFVAGVLALWWLPAATPTCLAACAPTPKRVDCYHGRMVEGEVLVMRWTFWQERRRLGEAKKPGPGANQDKEGAGERLTVGSVNVTSLTDNWKLLEPLAVDVWLLHKFWFHQHEAAGLPHALGQGAK